MFKETDFLNFDDIMKAVKGETTDVSRDLETVANSKSYYSILVQTSLILVQFCPKKFNIHFLFHLKSKEAQRYCILVTLGPKLTDCFGY